MKKRQTIKKMMALLLALTTLCSLVIPATAAERSGASSTSVSFEETDSSAVSYSYLTGDLTDETRYNTPLIGLNTSLLAEGLVLSSERGESVTAEEIRASSRSSAIWHQKTPWGTFDYDATF